MPEYVYALHDFLPEHEDEVDFRAGERIEVVEKDDLYGDGWWQGRNLAGKSGLFPKSYTAPAPPSNISAIQPPQAAIEAAGSSVQNESKPVLQALTEEPETDSPILPDIVSPVPKPPPVVFLNGHDESDYDAGLSDVSGGDGEVMKATMTDVQKAIEQLGRNRVDGDGGRSFSFASTHDGGETETDETDFDLSDVDGPDAIGTQGEDWHKGARRKLAEKARRAVEEAQKLEAIMASGSERRAIAPPIDVELSDESDDEGDLLDRDRKDYTSRSTNFQRDHPYIPEEDEDEEVVSLVDFQDNGQFAKHQQEISTATTVTPIPTSTSSVSVDAQGVATPKRDDHDVLTATRESFPTFQPLPMPSSSTQQVSDGERATSPTALVFLPTPVSPNTAIAENIPTPIPPVEQLKRSSAPAPVHREPIGTLPSPSPSTHGSAFGLTTPFSSQGSTISSLFPSASTNATSAPLHQSISTSAEDRKEKTHPNDWSIEEVVEWLKSKGFDQDVCDKFIEQEITGDVLLELDVNLLKTEIGILAFGKRMRIANAITDLRRPPSIVSFDHHPEHPPPSSPSAIHSQAHSRTQSQTHSHHSFPGTASHSYSQSIQSSVGSPLGYGNMNGGTFNSQFGSVAEAPVAEPSVNGNHVNGTTETLAVASAVAMAGIGLGIGMTSDANGKVPKGRPSQLTLSPSDGALKDKVVLLDVPSQHEDEDRAHMSDGEIVSTSRSMRRRLFGRSHDSSASAGNSSRHSKEAPSPIPSPTVKDTSDKDKDTTTSATVGTRHRSKRSTDGKSADRLSIFGTTFSGTLGKNRKPPPSEDFTLDKSPSMFSLPKLHSNSTRKASSTSNRPSTPVGSPKKGSQEVKEKTRTVSTAVAVFDLPKEVEKEEPSGKSSGERSTLRKRTTSSGNPGQGGATNGATDATNGMTGSIGAIKQGLSILEQIGEPDHSGWMRMKGVRYNSWKLRYFVMKGEHLYVLRSSNKNETKLKGYINIHGYKVTVDESLDPGRYGFRIDHDHDKTHYFSSDEKSIIREWMKAIMKATIGRDYTRPVVSSCNIPTIPLVVAQAMNPAPRPPSPSARDATQKALRRENPNQLSSRDARILMGLPNATDAKDAKTRLNSFFSDDGNDVTPATPRSSAPPRPSREMRRMNSNRSTTTAADESLVEWANSHLSESLQVTDSSGPLFTGLALLRIAESIKGKPASPPVPDSAFPSDTSDDKLDGLFRLFDYLLDNDVKMGSVSINDVRSGKRDKILQLLRALKAWEEKRRALALSMGNPIQAGSFVVPPGMQFAIY